MYIITGMILPYSFFLNNSSLKKIVKEYSNANLIKEPYINPIKKKFKISKYTSTR